MSTVLIIVIAVVVILVVAGLLLMLSPKARERSRVRKREQELDQRRERVVDHHREEAVGRERQAEVAEQRARVAAQEAERERAESRLAEEKAKLHERGLADDELIGEEERERFAGTSATESSRGDASSTTGAAVPNTARGGDVGSETDEVAGRQEAGDGPDPELQSSRTTAYEDGQAVPDRDPSPAEDLEAGQRRDERR